MVTETMYDIRQMAFNLDWATIAFCSIAKEGCISFNLQNSDFFTEVGKHVIYMKVQWCEDFSVIWS